MIEFYSFPPMNVAPYVGAVSTLTIIFLPFTRLFIFSS